MIDLHCHILPGIDDGAVDEGVALEMARMAIADGIVTIVCTPHITPGVYNNTAEGIEAAVRRFEATLNDAGVPLNLATGADVHLVQGLAEQLRDRQVPTLAGSRYFLLEPPHHVLPPRLGEVVAELLAAGYVPIITHPERLSWIETHYGVIESLAGLGAPIQITAASLLGRFGRRARYWSERMLDEGIVDFVASDGHGVDHRPPLLSEAREGVSAAHGEEIATRLFVSNPMKVLENEPLAAATSPSRPPATRPAARFGATRA